MLRLGETSYGGRAYFAAIDIPAHTIVLSDLPTIVAVLDDFRKEVCIYCFHYKNGSSLKFHVGTASRACSKACLEASMQTIPENVIHAWDAVQRWKGKGDTYLDLLRFCISALPLFTDSFPIVHEEQQTANAKTWEVHKDVLKHERDAFLCLQDDFQASTTIERDSCVGVADALRILVPSKTIDYTEFVQKVAGRSKSNAFGIWQQDASGTAFPESEMLGFALYCKSSYFNHACMPNVEKRRRGRVMQFETSRAITAGEELVISYLGDREHHGVKARREALRGWGFECACSLCLEEASALQSHEEAQN